MTIGIPIGLVRHRLGVRAYGHLRQQGQFPVRPTDPQDCRERAAHEKDLLHIGRIARFASDLCRLRPEPSTAAASRPSTGPPSACFSASLSLTLVITYWAAKRTVSAARFLLGGRRHHRLPERPRDRRRLHVGGLVPGHFRPRLHLRLRRPDLFGRLAGRLADRHVPDRRAAAQSRQVHLRRRRLVPARADADPHSGRLRLAGHGRLLPDRADGRRRQADPAAVRPATTGSRWCWSAA